MKCAVLCLTMIISINLLFSIVVNHIPPANLSPGQQTEIRIEVIQGMSNILNPELLYRIQGRDVYQPVKMEIESTDSNWLKGYLPALSDPDQSYEYYFRFTLINSSVETYPVIEPDLHPYIIKSSQASGEQQAGFVLLSDEPSRSAKDGYLLAVSWYALEAGIDNTSIKVYVNGRDVTANCYIGNTMLLYQEKTAKPGIISAYVKVMTKESRQIISPVWKTVIKPTGTITMLPLNLRGSVNAGTNVYGITQDNAARTFGSGLDDGWTSLDMYATYEKLNLLSYTYLSTLQDEDKQNVNRFRLGIQLPFWQTYVGDYSPTMNGLTMNNRNIRGLYTKLQGRNIGFSLAQGEMIRSINGQSYNDSLTSARVNTAGTFKQEAFAARLQLGRPQGFLMGFTTTRNRDIISSLPDKFVTKSDTILVRPQDNLVLSWDTKLTIPKIHLAMGLEAAGSLYNKNILNGAISRDSLESYLGTSVSLDPSGFQDIFVINTNMEPLPMSSHLSGLSSVTAWQAFIRNQMAGNLLNFSISQIGASYHALSTNYMPRDITRWMVSDQYNYKQYVIFTGGLSQNRDNLSKSLQDTNISNSAYVQGMLRLPKYPYFSATYSSLNGKNERNDNIVLDSLATHYQYKQNTQAITLGIGYEFGMLPLAPTTLDVSWRTGESTQDTAQSDDVFTRQYKIGSDNFSIGLSSRFTQIPLKTQFTISTNDQTVIIDEKNKNTNLNFLMRGEYKLLNQKLTPWGEFRFTNLAGDQDKQSYNYVTFGLDAIPLENTSLSTNLGWQVYKNNDVSNVDYTKIVWHLTLTRRF